MFEKVLVEQDAGDRVQMAVNESTPEWSGKLRPRNESEIEGACSCAAPRRDQQRR